MSVLKGKYGYFDDQGNSYVITDWKTPKPWSNVISNGRWGLTLTQTGGGYSWLDHAMLNRITRWEQDLISDNHGKYIFIRDEEKDNYWSATPMPLKPDFSSFTCRHGIGFTEFNSVFSHIKTTLRVFVPQNLCCEIWELKIKNQSKKPRKLSSFTSFYPVLDVFPDWHREFHKTFITSEYSKKHQGLIFRKKLWTASLSTDSSWNKSWPYEMFFLSSIKPDSFETSREHFLGQYNTYSDAQALNGVKLSDSTGTGYEQTACLKHSFTLKPGEEITISYCLGAEEAGNTENMLKKYSQALKKSPALFSKTTEFWEEFCGKLKVSTPDPAINVLINYWLKYQAFSCRVLGRSATYQCGGAFGFRDQLQDSLIFLSLDPVKTKKQILEHASHQRSDGIVQHWWHPVSNEGRINEITDNLLWLPYAILEYLNETGDNEILSEKMPYLDKGKGTILEHCLKAADKALERMSSRGLSLMGEGDWNDGMNGIGTGWKGESVWLSIFLFGITDRLSSLLLNLDKTDLSQKYKTASEKLKSAVLKHAFNKKWFIRATDDNGKIIGDESCAQGKIFVNPQSWAVITGLVDQKTGKAILSHVEKQLYRDYGVLLFHPAFSEADRNIGYLSRYAPGVRENGGVYTHAACWAVIAQALTGNTEKVYDTFRRICPALLSDADPDRYKGEPYVTPGNIEGPESCDEGKGAWTWYTGSAAWLFRACTEYLLGVRVEKGELVVKPCIPEDWDGFTMERIFRGKKYEISVKQVKGKCAVKIVSEK